MSPDQFLFIDELKVMGYGESDTSGCWLKLQIDEDVMALIRGRKGQMLEIAARVIDDDGTRHNGQADKPATQDRPKGGPLSYDAAGYCNSKTFRSYVGYMNVLYRPATEDEAAAYLREYCKVSSRALLDHEELAALAYKKLQRCVSAWAAKRDGF